MKQSGQRVILAATVLASAAGVLAEEAWVRMAASPEVQVFVDVSSLTRDAHGLRSVWTKTRYASEQADVGVRYTADMTLFVLDCAGARYGIAGGRFLDASGNVLRQFTGPTGELQPIRVATKADAVAKAVCAVDVNIQRGK
ncbi:surface-adhesin E family protein [Paraburkholderia sp. BR14320]|uniref:surface-adhesin E family protein n=1 Tax=unclassified Paraburkholderia TaxID=2615204 RepID=UPI0034CF6D0D